MKKLTLLFNSVLAAFATASLQSYATSTTTFTETISNIDYEIEGSTYPGHFTDASLKSGSTVFNNSAYTITSAQVDLTILNDTSLPVTLTIDGISANLTPSSSPQTLDYTLTSVQDSYIQSLDGTFNYGVVVDCELENAELIVNASPANQGTTGQGSTVPDGGSTIMLLGGVISALGLMKRKMA